MMDPPCSWASRGTMATDTKLTSATKTTTVAITWSFMVAPSSPALFVEPGHVGRPLLLDDYDDVLAEDRCALEGQQQVPRGLQHEDVPTVAGARRPPQCRPALELDRRGVDPGHVETRGTQDRDGQDALVPHVQRVRTRLGLDVDGDHGAGPDRNAPAVGDVRQDRLGTGGKDLDEPAPLPDAEPKEVLGHIQVVQGIELHEDRGAQTRGKDVDESAG